MHHKDKVKIPTCIARDKTQSANKTFPPRLRKQLQYYAWSTRRISPSCAVEQQMERLARTFPILRDTSTVVLHVCINS